MIIIILILRSQHRIDVSVFSLVAEIIWGHGGHYQADHDEHDHVLPATLESERTNYKSNYSKLCLLVTYRNANPTMKRTWMKQAVKLLQLYQLRSTPLQCHRLPIILATQKHLPSTTTNHQLNLIAMIQETKRQIPNTRHLIHWHLHLHHDNSTLHHDTYYQFW